MGELKTLPVVSLSEVRFCRLVHLKSNGDVEFASETHCFVWDPTAVRAILDAKPGRQPMVALLTRTRR